MSLKIFISEVSDGPMKPVDINNQISVLATRTKFLQKNGIDPAKTTLVGIEYDTKNYKNYKMISDNEKGDGIITESAIIADALVVNKTNHALFLPLADCIGAVLYIKSKNILMLSHLGRHSLEQFGGTESVNYLINNFNIEPVDIAIWLSPSAGKDNYPLTTFNNRSLQDVAIEQFVSTGIPIDNITKSNTDTTTNDKYYSHSQYLKGKRNSDGRFAIIATIESLPLV